MGSWLPAFSVPIRLISHSQLCGVCNSWCKHKYKNRRITQLQCSVLSIIWRGTAAGPMPVAETAPGYPEQGPRRRTARGPGLDPAPSRTACTTPTAARQVRWGAPPRHGWPRCFARCFSSRPLATRRAASNQLRSSSSGGSSGRVGGCAHMPAALAAATPLGASSSTRQQLGSGAGCHRPAACRKMSGAGFPLLIWSPAAAAAGGWQARNRVLGCSCAACSAAKAAIPGNRCQLFPFLAWDREQAQAFPSSFPTPTCHSVIEQLKQLPMQRGLQGEVAKVGGGGQAHGHPAGRQVAQQALCGRASSPEGSGQGLQCGVSGQRAATPLLLLLLLLECLPPHVRVEARWQQHTSRA